MAKLSIDGHNILRLISISWTYLTSDDSYDLGSDEEGAGVTARGGKMTYKLSLSTENLADNRRTIAQTQI